MPKGVGVYVGRNEVIAVSVTRTPAGPQIKSFAIESINPEAAQEPAVDKKSQKIKQLSAEAQAIYKALEKIKEPKAYVTAAVSPFQVVSRHFIMPSVPKKEEMQAVRYEASRYIPFKLTESVLDYCAQLTHKNVFSVTATAMRQEILDTCLEDLRSAGAHVLMIEPVYSAVGRAFSALNMIGQNKTQGFVVVQSDGNVNVTIASKGIVYLSRDFLLAGNPEEDKARFFEELKASVDYFYKLTGGESVAQIFLAGQGDLKFWVEHLEHALNYTVRFDVASFPNEKNITPDTLSSILVAYGLALRGLNYKSPLGEMKLLPKEDRISTLPQLLSFIGLGSLLVVVLFLLVRMIAFQPLIFSLAKQNSMLLENARQRNAAISQQPLSVLQLEKEKMASRVQQLKGFLRGKDVPYNLFLELGRGLPKSIVLDYVSFEDIPASGKISKRLKRFNVRGTCSLGGAEQEAAEINNWIKSLGAKKVYAENFPELKLEESKRDKSSVGADITRFRIVGE